MTGLLVTALVFGVQCSRVQQGQLDTFDWSRAGLGWQRVGTATQGQQDTLPGPFGPLLVNVGPYGGMLVYETWQSRPPLHHIEWTDYFDEGEAHVDRCAFGAVPSWGGGYHTFAPGVRS